MTTAYDVDQDRATNVVMDSSVSIDPDHQYGGWYETYDLETEDSSDGEGNKGVVLTGYDGCFELPDYIIKALEDKGVIIDL